MSVEYLLSGNTIKIQTVYEDFGTFMSETRDPVYRTILKAFNELLKEDAVKVVVQAHVDNVDFESELEFNISNTKILTDIILPYFESIEDYETCADVVKLHKKLISQ